MNTRQLLNPDYIPNNCFCIINIYVVWFHVSIVSFLCTLLLSDIHLTVQLL